MKSLWAILTVLVTGAFTNEPVLAQAQAGMSACSPKGISLVYINGMDNDPSDANLSGLALQRLVGPKSTKNAPITYSVAYNPSVRVLGKPVGDLVDAIRQKAVELGLSSIKPVTSIYINGYDPGTLLRAQVTNIVNSASNYFANKIVSIAANPNDPDFQRIMSSLGQLPPENAIQMVGHSQGNFYMNLAYGSLVSGGRSAGSVNAYGVATPTSSIRGNLSTNHTTSDTDTVIAQVAAIAGALRPNVPGPTELQLSAVNADPKGHSFISVYANPLFPGLSESIRKNVLAGLDELEIEMPASQIASMCQVRMTLTGSNPNWIIPSNEVVLSGLSPVGRGLYPIRGTSGSSCGGEIGSPLYSQDSRISQTSTFFESRFVVDAPYFITNPPNGRPCSSFVALESVPDPNGLLPPKNRIWANATARGFVFSGFGRRDYESQVRFDSGDPWDSNGYQCLAGYAPNLFAGFVPDWQPASCSAVLEVK